jgi:hypothetical protein
MPDYDRAKHLELISKAIERMDKSATSLKALSPAVLGVAFLLVDKKVPAWLAVGAAAVAVGIYWYIDAQYLGRERAFRRLYDQVRKAELDDNPYVMDIGGLYGRSPVWHCMRVGSVAGVHCVVLMLLLLGFLALSLFPKT